MKVISKIDSTFEKVVSWILVASLAVILSVSVLGIVLRQFSISLIWIEPFVRHLVFLATFLGGVIATGRGNHIAIDILKRYLESKEKTVFLKYLNFFVSVLCIFTLFWLVKVGITLSSIELEFGKPRFLGIHSGWLTAIIPFGFSLLAIRFLLKLILSFDKESE